MKTLQFDGGILVRLDRGEEITATLEGFLEAQKIHGGTVTGLGGIRDADLGFYDLSTRNYLQKTIPGNLELVHYSGNITLNEGKPFIHAHAVISGYDFRPLSGHFLQAIVALTGEFVIHPADWRVNRKPDEFTGLMLMDLSG